MWATAEQVGQFLVNAGVVSAPPDGLDVFVALARESFETQTGYRPFFGQSMVLTFDEPYDGRLYVPQGLLEATSVKLGGVNLVEGTDYTLEPRYAMQQHDPAHFLDFGGGVGSSRPPYSSGLTIDGTFGRLRGSDPRADVVRHAHTSLAAAMALEYAAGTPGEATEQQQGTVKLKFSTGAGTGRADRWRELARGIAMGYRNVTP